MKVSNLKCGNKKIVYQFLENRNVTNDNYYCIQTMQKNNYELITLLPDNMSLPELDFKMKRDIVRYHTLYTKGGLFTDTNILAFEIDDLYDYDLVVIKDDLFLNNIILSKPNIDLFKNLYELLITNIKANIFTDYSRIFHDLVKSFIETSSLKIKILTKKKGNIYEYSPTLFSLPEGSWINSSRNYSMRGNILTAECADSSGKWKKNKILTVPGTQYYNVNGAIDWDPITLFCSEKPFFASVNISQPNSSTSLLNPKNKTIFMTYKKNIPSKVSDRWKKLNPTYNIEFSMDSNCIELLESMNTYISNLFKRISRGMYKADLWRLCKIYKNGGVYADVDLVPYINLDILDKDVTFYSCLSVAKQSIFQAFIVNHKPKSGLIYLMLLSFLLNNPQNYSNGPTYDMFNVLQYNIKEPIKPLQKYKLDTVRLEIKIGSSNTPEKRINLFYFPIEKYEIQIKEHPYKHIFELSIKNNVLFVKRVDLEEGWDHAHSCELIIQSKEVIYLLDERSGPNGNWVTSSVYDKSCKILDSRDMEYYHNGGW